MSRSDEGKKEEKTVTRVRGRRARKYEEERRREKKKRKKPVTRVRGRRVRRSEVALPSARRAAVSDWKPDAA